MKNSILKSFVVFALMAITLNTFAQNNHYFSGNTLYDPYGKCQLYFPGEPEYAAQNIDTDMGSVTMYQFIYQTSDNAAYMFSYVDYPADKIAGQDVVQLLKRAAGGFINYLKLTSRSENIINYGNHKGVMFAADDGNNFTTMRDYLVNNRLYQLGIYRVGGTISVKEENDFFDSFVLTK